MLKSFHSNGFSAPITKLNLRRNEKEFETRQWLTPATLADVQALLESAGDDPAVLAQVKLAIPAYVLRHLGFESA